MNTILKRLQKKAILNQNRWIYLRRLFHKIPELSWKEEKTINLLFSIIKELHNNHPDKFKFFEIRGGIIIDFFSPNAKKTLLFRADIDGLPINEETNLPFSSEHTGLMHACGHDFHIAMLFGCLELLCDSNEYPTSNIRFVFQRAEEVGIEDCGALACIKENILSSIDLVFCLHISSKYEKGVFFSNPNYLLANTTQVEIEVSCSGGHVMTPDIGANSIDILNEILNFITKLNFDNHSSMIIVPTLLEAKQAINIRPNKGLLNLSIRSFLNKKELTNFINKLEEDILIIIKKFPTGKLQNFKISFGYPVLKNDEKTFTLQSTILSSFYKVKKIDPFFAGEDFSYYLEKKPGCYWILGAKNGEGQDHHTSIFNPSEDILADGVFYWLSIAFFFFEDKH